MDPSRYLPPNEVDSTSSRLLERLGNKEPEAWRQLVRLYGPVVRHWIRQAGLNKADLADVFQETFLAVSRNIEAFHRQTGQAKFRAWLKTITVSKVNDHFRRQGKQSLAFGGSTALLRLGEIEAAETDSDEAAAATGDENEDADGALAHPEEAFLAQRVLQVVKKEFREKTWKAFHRTAIEGCTSRQVGEELGMSVVAVRKAKSRVMKRLKATLSKPEPPSSSDGPL